MNCWKSVLTVVLLGQSCLATADSVGGEGAIDPRVATVIEDLSLREAAEPSRDLPRWAPPRKIAVFIPGSMRDDPEPLLARVRAVAADAEVIGFGGPDQDPGASRAADVILGFCNPSLLEAHPALRYLHSYAVGVDRCALAEDIGDYDFILTNNQRLSGPDIAEHAIAMMMALTRHLPAYARAQRDGNWEFRGDAINVNGRTMLVLGLGGIGTEVARRAHALGMRVLATRNSSRKGPEFVEYVGLADETNELAGKADVVVNALPLTRSTLGMIDPAFFEAMRDGAIYISVGRGRTTRTDALLSALQSGKLRGAGLDVTDPEPLPPQHPLWGMDNVLISPHVAAATDEARDRSLLIAIENLRRYVAGEPLLNMVDLRRGY